MKKQISKYLIWLAIVAAVMMLIAMFTGHNPIAQKVVHFSGSLAMMCGLIWLAMNFKSPNY